MGPARRCWARAPTAQGAARHGHRLPNPGGPRGGLDKNGEYIDALGALGFGFIEIGTVTPRPQPAIPSRACSGCASTRRSSTAWASTTQGVEKLLRNVERASFRGVLGINIGKNFDTPIERAATTTSPAWTRSTTARLRDREHLLAQHEEPARPAVQRRAGRAAGRRDGRRADARAALRQGKPLLVKVAPDLDDEQVEAIAALAVKHAVDGLIATNTTLGARAVAGHRHAARAGAQRPPLFEPSTEVLRELATLRCKGRAPDRRGRDRLGHARQGEDRRGCQPGAGLHRLRLPRPGAHRRSTPRAAMIVGVPRETKEGERRVALLPLAVEEITAGGHDVRVETRAGKGPRLWTTRPIATPAPTSWSRADVWDRGPHRQGEGGAGADLAVMPDGVTIFSVSPPAPRARAHARAGCPWRDRDRLRDGARRRGDFPLLAPMSRIAGAWPSSDFPHARCSCSARACRLGGARRRHGAAERGRGAR
jgi:dihydroorotate dehydrogenase